MLSEAPEISINTATTPSVGIQGGSTTSAARWNREKDIVINTERVTDASNELWRIILEGYKPFNANKLNIREEVHHQLNSVALNMIHQAMGSKNLAYIRNFTTAKEAWDGLSEIFVGSESMERNKFSSLRIQDEGFMRAKVKLLKKEKAKFGVAHEKLVKDLDDLDKAHKALNSEHSLLTKSDEQLQIRLDKYGVPSSSISTCDHANIIEENARLKDELTKASSPQNKLYLDDLLSSQRSNNGKECLGYNAKEKNSNKKKAKPAQEKKKDYAAEDSKWVLDSGCTIHMTGDKDLVKELRPNIHDLTVSFGDNTTYKVLGVGKVVVSHNITLVDAMLVKTLGYNLLVVPALSKMGFTFFIDRDIVVLLWSKTLKVAFVGYRENNLYVVDFSGPPLQV
ncbi:hypothetical protein QYE76_046155 [Lolium multiflorum]|uniref:Retrovirus-related Pol polyprotein from transposon TNT 1-94-like beta-barrel domain-containing protein n=1 Tax=Lolium multiflorum TaxID=4521 RepID=A0AAD8WY45_LOLMU|nr:hypothetical protein QYE76_046155 [Lolium multiflorum]